MHKKVGSQEKQDDRGATCLKDFHRRPSYTATTCSSSRGQTPASLGIDMKMKLSSSSSSPPLSVPPPPPPPSLPHPRAQASSSSSSSSSLHQQPRCLSSGAPVGSIAPADRSTRQPLPPPTGVALKDFLWRHEKTFQSESGRIRGPGMDRAEVSPTRKDEAQRTSRSSPASMAAHQLDKLKRFLDTLLKLGSDTSVSLGLKVHSLIRALLDEQISIETFYDRICRETNFPLRPLVIPFLKSSLPMLQQEMARLAEASTFSAGQHLQVNDVGLLRGFGVCGDVVQSKPEALLKATDLQKKHEDQGRLKEHNRKISETRPETEARNVRSKSPSPSRKRMRTRSPLCSGGSIGRLERTGSDVSDDVFHRGSTTSLGRTADQEVFSEKLNHRLSSAPPVDGIEALRMVNQSLERDRVLHRRRGASEDTAILASGNADQLLHDATNEKDDGFAYVENTLKCISGLVVQCQRAIYEIQERTFLGDRGFPVIHRRVFPQDSFYTASSTSSSSSSSSSSTSSCESLLSRVLSWGLAPHPLESWATIDRPRKEGDAASDTKRKAMVELQTAAAAAVDAEAKNCETAALDRMRLEVVMEEVRERTRAEVAALFNRQVKNKESGCWNCGRAASETCSGCNVARYCGVFCQHRHWEVHHKACGKSSVLLPTPLPPPPPPPPPPGVSARPLLRSALKDPLNTSSSSDGDSIVRTAAAAADDDAASQIRHGSLSTAAEAGRLRSGWLNSIEMPKVSVNVKQEAAF